VRRPATDSDGVLPRGATEMPYRNMTLAELARHIGMDAREVRRLADRGVLPGKLVGGEWRFNRAQMLDWLQREMHTLDPEHLQNLDRAMSQIRDEAVISSLLATEAVDMNLPAKSRASVLRELVGLAERTGMVYDRAEIVAALEQREALASTALPGGLAFPHPRRPLPYATAEPMVCLARVPAGVPFGAPDGQLTDLFALVCCHDERQHLLTLARLALLFSGELPQELRDTDDSEEALELVLQTERQMLRKRG
jgi:PTS system nitrogen regulatory IIA component